MGSLTNNGQIDTGFYWGSSYDAKQQFLSYWYQISEIIRQEPKRVLEIGVGQGFVSKYLKEKGYRIETIDIDEQLEPDHIGDVLDLPFPNDSFDCVACFEVLEHLKYEDFGNALSEIYRVTANSALISLPDSRYYLEIYFKTYGFGELKTLLSLPWTGLRSRFLWHFGKEKSINHSVHYWEIGKVGYSLKTGI